MLDALRWLGVACSGVLLLDPRAIRYAHPQSPAKKYPLTCEKHPRSHPTMGYDPGMPSPSTPCPYCGSPATRSIRPNGATEDDCPACCLVYVTPLGSARPTIHYRPEALIAEARRLFPPS